MNAVIASMIKHSGRSWWQCRYSSGKILSEWDTLTTKLRLPVGPGGSSRWEEVNKDGMVALRLLCPNGMAGELEAPEGHKFFQLKAGGIMVGAGKASHYLGAHIIGVVRDVTGECLCRAWDYRSKLLVEFEDNIYSMQYLQIGCLSLEVQGLKV
ncbi:MAG: hypothetical protein Q8O55_01500 [Dehalococcoidales bacterium]|nr:hypothetical protein [Dehalococcoidales bacterium]